MKVIRCFPTLITDRFGNSVNLNWVGTQLRSMTASDGRVITLTYVNGTNRIATVSDGGRLWRYAYDANNNLDSVTRPGGTAWLYDLTPLFHARVEYFSPGFCNSGTMANTSFTGTITHPSGAVGTFTVAPTRHGRSYVPYNCITTGPNFGHLTQPGTFDTLALTNKQIAGPGLGSIGWEYTYSVAEPCYVSGFGGQTPPNPCPSTLESKPKSVSVRLSEVPLSGSPRDIVSLYTFGQYSRRCRFFAANCAPSHEAQHVQRCSQRCLVHLDGIELGHLRQSDRDEPQQWREDEDRDDYLCIEYGSVGIRADRSGEGHQHKCRRTRHRLQQQCAADHAQGV